MPTNMSDYKKPRSAYTKLQINHPYLMDKNTIQYDHMYVQTTPIVLFRHTNINYYVSIIEHAKVQYHNVHMCVFLLPKY